jgi:hypothetical protein
MGKSATTLGFPGRNPGWAEAKPPDAFTEPRSGIGIALSVGDRSAAAFLLADRFQRAEESVSPCANVV